MDIISTALSVILAIVFIAGAVMNLAGAAPMRQTAEHLDIPYPRYRLIGVVEAAAGAGLLIGLAVPLLGVAAAIGLVALMAGAVIFHRRAGDPMKAAAPALVLGIVALATAIVIVLAG